MFDPIKLTEEVKKIVCRDNERLYARFRPARFYGGISSCDVCGCNLRCIFCWGWKFVNQPEKYGKFYSAKEVAKRLIGITEKFKFRTLRITGAEPSIGREHLLKLLELISQTNYSFILETNGILIDNNYAAQLAKYKDFIHVRVSLKGSNEEEFSKLTGAKPEAFELQLNALRNLLSADVPCHPAVMVSFSSKENIRNLRERLKAIAPEFADFEQEELILYSNIKQRLEQVGIKYKSAYEPERTPKRLI